MYYIFTSSRSRFWWSGLNFYGQFARMEPASICWNCKLNFGSNFSIYYYFEEFCINANEASFSAGTDLLMSGIANEYLALSLTLSLSECVCASACVCACVLSRQLFFLFGQLHHIWKKSNTWTCFGVIQECPSGLYPSYTIKRWISYM